MSVVANYKKARVYENSLLQQVVLRFGMQE